MTSHKVLIVEDDKWVAENHAMILQRAGFACEVVHSADDAVGTIDEFTPDVILLDFFLPGANAMQLLHELQSYDDTAMTPIVLCTSFSEAKKEAEALDAYGVRIVLDKSTVTPKQLAKAVTDVIV